jgi:hypothetical protein
MKKTYKVDSEKFIKIIIKFDLIGSRKPKKPEKIHLGPKSHTEQKEKVFKFQKAEII